MKFIFLVFFLTSSSLAACEFDTDCAVGSVCIKSGMNIYGVCAGGMNPGNSNDSQPVYKPLDVVGTYGNTCQFDTDCGPGKSCLKSSFSLYGVCN